MTGKKRKKISFIDDSSFFNLIEFFPYAIIIQQGSKVQYVNNKAAKSFCADKGAETDESIPDLPNELNELCNISSNNKTNPYKYYHRTITHDGSTHELVLFSILIRYQDKPATMTIIRDITEEITIERKFNETEWCYKSLSESSLVGVYLYDENRICYVNKYIEDLLEYSSHELLNMSFNAIIHPDDLKSNKTGGEDRSQSRQLRMIKKNGNYLHVLTQSAPFKSDYSEAVLGTLLDITHLKTTEEKIKHMAYYDLLTGLPNRYWLYECGNQSIEEPLHSKERLGFIFIYLDRLKVLYDIFGDDYCDEILKQATERLYLCTGERGVICRYGSDEFVVMIRDADKHKCILFADRIIKSFNNPFILNDYEVGATASIGISMFPDDGDCTETLVKNANAAMYYAKEKGKCCYQFFSSSLKEKISKKLDLEYDLRKALS